MKRFWFGFASSLLIAATGLPTEVAAADDAATEKPAPAEAGADVKKQPENRSVESPGEGVRETPRSDSPSQSQRVLPLRAGDRRGGTPVWIGAMCVPADDTLQAQLALADGVGLVVARIMPGSPADQAGLKIHDVVTAIDGRPAGDLASLMAAVEAAGEVGLKLEVIRAGKKQSLVVVPAPRPDGDVVIRPGLALPPGAVVDPQQREEHLRRLQEQIDKMRGRLPEADEKRLQEWLDRMRRGENQPLRLQLFGPGLVMQGGTLPEGVNVVIVRNGAAPTRVTVTRGAEKWEVTENELDKLPEDLRDSIRAMIEKK